MTNYDWIDDESTYLRKALSMYETYYRNLELTINLTESERIKLKTTHMIPEEIFYNKSLSDSIRDIAINSPCNFEQAVRLLKKSKDHNRDVELIKKLTNCGLTENLVNTFITAINS